jgi:hypothetical protein
VIERPTPQTGYGILFRSATDWMYATTYRYVGNGRWTQIHPRVGEYEWVYKSASTNNWTDYRTGQPVRFFNLTNVARGYWYRIDLNVYSGLLGHWTPSPYTGSWACQA